MLWNPHCCFFFFFLSLLLGAAFEKLGAKLSDEDKETLFEAANDVIDWLDDNVDADRDDYKEKQQEFDDIVQPILKDFYQENPGAGAGASGGYDDDDDDDSYTDHEDL